MRIWWLEKSKKDDTSHRFVRKMTSMTFCMLVTVYCRILRLGLAKKLEKIA